MKKTFIGVRLESGKIQMKQKINKTPLNKQISKKQTDKQTKNEFEEGVFLSFFQIGREHFYKCFDESAQFRLEIQR